MRNLIAGLIAGIVLGATSIAGAAQLYWSERGTGYVCEGVNQGVTCNAGNYQVGVTPSYVFVQHRRTEATFGCRKRSSFSQCTSD